MMIEVLVADVPGAEDGFTLYFSDRPFPRCEVRLDWLRSENGGNWYRLAGTRIEGWLSPAMFRYFSAAPEFIYATAQAGERWTTGQRGWTCVADEVPDGLLKGDQS
jgi:hypothetical protein